MATMSVVRCVVVESISPDGTAAINSQWSWRRSDGRIQPWEFTRDGRDFEVEVDGRLVVNDTVMGLDALRRGTGLGQVFAWQVRGDIAAGRLQSVLEDWQAPFPGWFVYYPAREHMAPKLRVFIDFMRERLDAGGR